MAMEEALVTRMTGAAPIAALAATRVSWFWFQRNDAGTRIALSMISPGENWTHEGPDGLLHPRVQIDCRAETATVALALARAVTSEMHEAAEVSGVRFHPAQKIAERFVDEGEQDGGKHFYRVSLDFLFYHETIA